MGKASRDKGQRRERQVVTLHQDMGVKAERVPLSGASKYQGNGADVDIYALGPDAAPMVSEVKARANGQGFTTLERWLGENDALLIYFAGHGYYDKLVKRGFWIPTEAREDVDGEPAEADWLSNATLINYVDSMKARHVLIVSDSCFSGSLMRGGAPDLSAKKNAYYRRAIAQPARWCLGSGDLETVPDQSVFARKFLQALQYPEKAVFSASDIAAAIRLDVAEYTGPGEDGAGGVVAGAV